MKLPKTFRAKGGIRTRLITLFLITALLPLAVLGLFNYTISKNNLTYAADRELLSKAVSAADSIDRWIGEKIKIIEAIAGNPVVKSGDLKNLLPLLYHIQPTLNNVQTLWYATPDGKVYIYREGDYTVPAGDITDRQYFKDLLATGKTVVSEVLIDKFTGSKIVVIASPVKGPSGITGIVGADVNVKVISDIVSSIKYGNTGYAFLVDKKGLTIAHPDESKIMNLNITNTGSESLNMVGQRMIKGEEAAVHYEFEGVSHGSRSGYSYTNIARLQPADIDACR